MFRRNNRATTAQVKHAISKGKVRHSAYISVRVLQKSGNMAKPSKLAVVVSKKVAPTAVARNTIKRRIRAALSEVWELDDGNTYIFYAKQGVGDLSPQHLKKELASLRS